MSEKFDFDKVKGLFDFFCGKKVGLGGNGNSRRMIMRKHRHGSVFEKRDFDELA